MHTEFAHLQDKGIDKIDGLKLYRKQNSTHTGSGCSRVVE